MKIIAIILLVLSVLFLVLEFTIAYIPSDTFSCRTPDGGPCPTLVPLVVPNAVFPFWLPPIALVGWIYSLMQFRKQQYSQSILFSIMIVLQFFVSYYLGSQGFWGLKDK